MKPTIVVSDASPLIALAVMDLLPVLNKLFEEVFVPPAVIKECLDDISKPMADEIAAALSNRILKEKPVADVSRCETLAQVLDLGEAEAIALAIELNAVAIIDEKAARTVAGREGIQCIGSLYVLIKAKQENLVPAAAPLIKKLLDHGYHLNESLISFVLNTCNETLESS